MEPNESQSAPAPVPAPPQEASAAPAKKAPHELSRLRLSHGRFSVWRLLRSLVTLVLVILLPFAATVAFGTYQMLYPTEISSTKNPKQQGNLDYNSVLLTTEDGITLTGWHIPARQPNGSAILVLHGYPADKGDILGRAAFLAETHDLLLIDFRSFGGSSGEYSTFGATETRDALAGVKWLQEKGFTRIGIYGYSMGGAVALMTLPQTNAVTAVVAEGSYADMRHVLERAFAYLGPLKTYAATFVDFASERVLHVDLDAVSPLRAVSTSQVPMLLVHNVDDPATPLAEGILLREAASQNPHMESFSPSGTPEEQARAFARTVRTFFRDTLDDSQTP